MILKKIFPKENRLSKNGLKSACSITNLVMYLYYQEPTWKQSVIEESKVFLQGKHTSEEMAVISSFLALVEKDWEKFSLELANLCKAHRKSKIMAKIHLQEKFPCSHLDCITLQGACIKKRSKISYFLKMNFYSRILEFTKKVTIIRRDKRFVFFEEPLLLLNDFEKIDLPTMRLTVGRKRTLDIENYRQEVIEKVQALHYDCRL